jgi:hypothetical protein
MENTADCSIMRYFLHEKKRDTPSAARVNQYRSRLIPRRRYDVVGCMISIGLSSIIDPLPPDARILVYLCGDECRVRNC